MMKRKTTIFFIYLILCFSVQSKESTSPDMLEVPGLVTTENNICANLNLALILTSENQEIINLLVNALPNPNKNKDTLKYLLLKLNYAKESIGELNSFSGSISFLMYFFQALTDLGTFDFKGKDLKILMNYLSKVYNIKLSTGVQSIMSKIRKIEITHSDNGKGSIKIRAKSDSIFQRIDESLKDEKTLSEEEKKEKDKNEDLDDDSAEYINTFKIKDKMKLSFDQTDFSNGKKINKSKKNKFTDFLTSKDSITNSISDKTRKKLRNIKFLKVKPLHITSTPSNSLMININTKKHDSVSLNIDELYIVPHLNNEQKKETDVLLNLNPLVPFFDNVKVAI